MDWLGAGIGFGITFAVVALGLAWRARFGKHYPAMALVEVRALLEDQALVEIEATAVL